MNIDLKKWFEDDEDQLKYSNKDLKIIEQLEAIGLGEDFLEVWKLWQ